MILRVDINSVISCILMKQSISIPSENSLINLIKIGGQRLTISLISLGLDFCQYILKRLNRLFKGQLIESFITIIKTVKLTHISWLFHFTLLRNNMTSVIVQNWQLIMTNLNQILSWLHLVEWIVCLWSWVISVWLGLAEVLLTAFWWWRLSVCFISWI